MNNSTGIPIIDLLIQHEEAIGSLYRACAAVFPDHARFWQAFSLEEKAHADVLRSLAAHLKTERVFLNNRKFNVTGLQTAINHVNRQKQLLGEGGVTPLQITSIALDVERAIIDRDFFEVFDTDSPSMKREFVSLRQHTCEHVGRMETMLNLLKQKSKG